MSNAPNGNKYEIELVRWPDFFFESQIATLTGLPWDDIILYSQNIKRWRGAAYIAVFRSLGFNCNTRFIKFDKQTERPCLMRSHKPGDKRYWYGFVYYDGWVYDVGRGIRLTWAEWNKVYPNYRVTSMLQVWI